MFFRKTKRDVVDPIQKEEESIDDQEYQRSESPVGAYWADRRFLDVMPFRDIVCFLLALTLAAGILIIGYALRSIFGPVLIALLLAYLFDPVVTLAKARTGMPRAITISLLLVGLFLIGLGFVLWLAPLLVSQIGGLIEDIQQFMNNPPAWMLYLVRLADLKISDLPETYGRLVQRLTQNPTEILHFLFAGSTEAVGFIGRVVGTTTYYAIIFILIPIYFFIFTWHFQHLYRLECYLPHRKKGKIVFIIRQMDGVVSNFFRGRLIVAAMMSVMYTIGWWLAGVPYALVMGILAGLLSIIPYVAVVVWPFSVLLAYIEAAGEAAGFSWFGVLIWPSVVYIAVQTVEGWVLTPWVQKSATDLSVVTIIIVVLIGGALGGLYGMILAIPIVACLKILVRELFLSRLRCWAENN